MVWVLPVGESGEYKSVYRGNRKAERLRGIEGTKRVINSEHEEEERKGIHREYIVVEEVMEESGGGGREK